MCGDCCRKQGSPPFAGELYARPREIIAIVDWFTEHDPYRYDYGRVCYFLSTDNKCLIYPYRPIACREFEPGIKPCSQLCPEEQLAESKTTRGQMIKFKEEAKKFSQMLHHELNCIVSRILKAIKKKNEI